MNHDLISIRYHGNLADPETERARQRIHWMCAQAAGRDVLDLGCSQGIVTLILAREGFHCTGVDVEESSLVHAREALAKEAELVQNRARFLVADATQLPFENASYDTVILGEVLEHLTQPMKVLGEARRILRPGGRLVVTVPYGLNAYHDHKYSYYPISLLAILEPQFRTVTIGTLTNYIIYSGLLDPAYDGANVSKEARFDDYLKLEKELEARCLQKERELYELGTKLYGRLKVLSAHTGNQAKELRELRDRVSSEKKLRTELEALKTQLAEADRTAEARLAEANLATETAQKPIEVLKKQIEVLQTENNWLRTKEKQAQQTIAQRDGEWMRRLNNQRVRALVSTVLPAGARVLVISKGDDDLLQLDGRIGKHFPQGPGGVYAGHHPADSAEAIGHLERLRVQGADFLLIPASSFWWMHHYGDFRKHLESQYRVASYHDEIGLIFALRSGTNEPKEKFVLTFPKEGTPAPAATASTPAKAASTTTPTTPAIAISTPASAEKPRPKIPGQLVVGGIMDEFTAACFGPECDLVTFRPDNWKATLDARPIDLLLVESAWQGNGGSWQYKIASFKKPMGEELVEVIDYCKARGIKTVFWNKEDPSHFDRFVHRARLFDHVFTTDADMLPAYREAIGHNRVGALPFAAQPRLHHPIVDTPRKHNVCFAGAYYALEHDERRADIDLMLRPALGHGLHIYDRQHGMVGPNAKAYQFPEIYQSAIQGRLEYADMVKAYKWYKVFLNVNSVKNSPTMFSRRVFELLASGTPVVSAYAKGIETMLGTDIVRIARSEAETETHLNKLLGDERYWAEISTRGVREVLLHHTYAHRLAEIYQQVGLKATAILDPKITVVARIQSRPDAERLMQTLARQTYRGFELTVLAGKTLANSVAPSLRNGLAQIPVTFVPDSKDPATMLLDLTGGGYVWWVNSGDYYGENFLQDAVLANRYAEPDVIGKQTHFASVEGKSAPVLVHSGSEFQWSSHLSPGSMLVKPGAFKLEHWRALVANQSVALTKLRAVSLDRFNYVKDGAQLQQANRRKSLTGILI